jgi:hypothetical protein
MKSVPFAPRGPQGPLLSSNRLGRREGASHHRSGQHQRSDMAERAELDLFRQAMNWAAVLDRIVGG